MKLLMKLLLVASPLLFSSASFAVSGTETWSIGFFGSVVTANEADMNALITRANTSIGISTPQFSNAYEFGAFIQRRFNGSVFALQFRPGYFMDSVSGTANNGSGGYNFTLSGFNLMPLIRAYILESQSIKLYLQGGIGWGTLSGKIEE